MKSYDYNGMEVCIEKTQYSNNDHLAVVLTTTNGEFFDVITTNLNHRMQSDSMAFVDTNNHPGIDKWLEEKGLAAPMYYTYQSGFCEYPLYTFFL